MVKRCRKQPQEIGQVVRGGDTKPPKKGNLRYPTCRDYDIEVLAMVWPSCLGLTPPTIVGRDEWSNNHGFLTTFYDDIEKIRKQTRTDGIV